MIILLCIFAWFFLGFLLINISVNDKVDAQMVLSVFVMWALWPVTAVLLFKKG